MSARYHYGPGEVYGTTYDLTPALYTFVEAAYYDREDDLGDGVAVGAAYLF